MAKNMFNKQMSTAESGWTCRIGNVLKFLIFNSNRSPTRCNNFQFIILTFIYSSTRFGRFSAHHQELNNCSSSLFFYLRIMVIAVLCSWSGYHHDTKVKPEAAPAVVELLMMGRRTPESCWAVNKRQDHKLKIVASSWLIYLNCMMTNGLANLKFLTFLIL